MLGAIGIDQGQIQKTAREPEPMPEAENHRPRDTRRYRAGYYEFEKGLLRYVIAAAASATATYENPGEGIRPH